MYSEPHRKMILDATSQGRVSDWIERIAEIARQLPGVDMSEVSWNEAPGSVADAVVHLANGCCGLKKLEEVVAVYRAASSPAAPEASAVTAKPLRVKPGGSFEIHSVSTVSPALQGMLCEVLLKVFPNGMGLDEFVRFQVAGEHLDHFTTTPASWRKKCAELITWCLENGKLPALLNGMRTQKPGNKELRDFVRDNAQDE